MLASCVLSFTVVQKLPRLLLVSEAQHHGPPRGLFGAFNRAFGRFRDAYGRLLEGALHRRAFVLACAGLLLVVSRRARHRSSGWISSRPPMWD